MIKNLPNLLTALRLLMVPVLVVLLVTPNKVGLYTAAIVFIAASVTDYFDGLIARKYKVVSDTGKLLDPLADKILVMSALIMITQIRVDGAAYLVPAWLVAILLCREFWVTGLRAMAAGKGVVVAADREGKIKTLLQMVAVPLLILYPTGFLRNIANLHFTGLMLLFISALFSLWSGVEYTRKVLKEVV